MSLVSGLRIFGAIVALLLSWGTIDRFNQAGKVKDLTTARDACDRGAGDVGAPLTDCPANVAASIRAARRSVECEAGLAVGDLYTIRTVCPAQAKDIAARLDVRTGELAEANRQLALAGAATAAAVSRAEARAVVSEVRRAENDRTIEAAPRTGDGRVRCDTECMRALAGEGGAARP